MAVVKSVGSLVATYHHLCFCFHLAPEIYFINLLIYFVNFIKTNVMYLFIKRECIMHASEGQLFLPTAARQITGCDVFLISSFHHVLYVVCFLLGNYPASGVYMPTFRNTLSVPSS